MSSDNAENKMETQAHIASEPKSEPVAAPAPPTDELVFLDPAVAEFRLTDQGQLEVCETSGSEWRAVRVFRLFPVSHKERLLSVQTEEKQELGLLQELEGFPPDSRAALRAALERHYLTPLIREIRSIQPQFGLWKWEVVTNRGERCFLTKNPSEQAQEPLSGRYIVSDLEGLRYEIPDWSELDPESRTQLEQVLG